jgi:hypothetical protein
MLLTDDEKRRFIDWLREDAYSNRLLAQQFGKSPNMTQENAIRFQMQSDAEEMVANILETSGGLF